MRIMQVSGADFNAGNYNYGKIDAKDKRDISYLGAAREMKIVPPNTLQAMFMQKITTAPSLVSTPYDKAVEKYTPQMQEVIEDFAQRQGKKGQFLNWVSLPAEQLKIGENGKSHLDEIYEQANELKSRSEDGKTRALVVLGIGGSKHTGEFLLNMSGAGKDESKGKVFFYADIEGVSFENFLTEAGGRVQDLNFLVVSKSGTTFETKEGYMRFKNALKEHYASQGLNEAQTEKAAQKHFGFVTDKTATEKNLRGEVGHKNGEGNEGVKELYVHDDVGGRFSMFDDAGLFELAYAGVEKTYAERILTAADRASKKALSSDNVKTNVAAKAAMFNIFAREAGRPLIQQQLFGKVFEGGGENWFKQLYLESLKDFNYNVGGAPASMHYASEGHFNPENKGKYSTILTKMNSGVSQNYKNYTNAIEASYNKDADTTVMVEELAVEGNRIKPEAIGEYIQYKHFETVYMGMLRRAVEDGASIAQSEAVPEVLQPSVEVYKNNFKPGSPFELKPGLKD